MKIYLDTSSLIKLYFKEAGTSRLDKVFTDFMVTDILLSEITKIEFFSAIYKKFRIKDLTQQNVDDIISAFGTDEHKYQFVLIDRDIVNSAQALISKYGGRGLRSLDAVQLACVQSSGCCRYDYF